MDEYTLERQLERTMLRRLLTASRHELLRSRTEIARLTAKLAIERRRKPHIRGPKATT